MLKISAVRIIIITLHYAGNGHSKNDIISYNDEDKHSKDEITP